MCGAAHATLLLRDGDAELIDPPDDVATLASAGRRAPRFHHRRGLSTDLAKHLLRAETELAAVPPLAGQLLTIGPKRNSAALGVVSASSPRGQSRPHCRSDRKREAARRW